MPRKFPSITINHQVLRIGLTVLLCILCASRQREFLTWNNLVDNLLVNAAPYGIMACGMTLVMIGGGFDLSIGSMAAVCSVVAATVSAHFVHAEPSLSLLIAIAVTLFAGAILGSINGTFVSLFRINPFVVTLAFMLIYRSLALLLSGGKPITVDSKLFESLNWGSVNLPGLPLERGMASIPIPILLFGVVVLPTLLALRFTPFGKHICAMGGSETAAWLSGVNTPWLKLATYMLMGITVALGSLIVTAKTVTGDPGGFRGDEMQVIAAVIIGGTPLGGGSGSAGGTVLGLLILMIIQNLLTLAGVGSDYRDMVNGAIILVVVAAETVAKTRRS